MPYYDYRCTDCGKKFQIRLSYEEYGSAAVQCSHCSSENVHRLIGRVRIARSSAIGLDSLSDESAWENLDQEDPRALASMMRSMSKEMGEDLPPDLDEVVDRLESGESPEDIEKDLPVDDGMDF